MLELGFAYMSSLPFWSVADDILKELADSLQCFCLIAATDAATTMWGGLLHRPPNARMFVDLPDVGRRAPTHTVAPGIVLLGALTGQDLNRALLACTAGDTGLDPVSSGARDPGPAPGVVVPIVPEQNFSEIAVPLMDGQGRIIAGMSVLSPLSRISAEDAVKQYLPRIQQAAEDINRLVGYRAPARERFPRHRPHETAEEDEMLEKEMIQPYGFKNVSAGDQVTGFQVRIRIPYYRGIWASLLEGADVTVDGEEFSRDPVLWTLGDKTLTLAEVEAATDVRWPFDEPAVLTVPKAGGLAVGMHDIRVKLAFRASYMPPDMGPWITRAERKLALTH